MPTDIPHRTNPGRAGLINQAIVDWALFLDVDEGSRQGRLSLETARLSEGFFEALKRAGRSRHTRALSNNSAALDCYLWLAYRLHALHQPRLVTWAALKAQHGASYPTTYHFKERFTGTLAMALAVYPEAKVEVQDRGVTLHPSRPPVAPRLIAAR